MKNLKWWRTAGPSSMNKAHVADQVEARHKGEPTIVARDASHAHGCLARIRCSRVATNMIPFVDHDDATAR